MWGVCFVSGCAGFECGFNWVGGFSLCGHLMYTGYTLIV